jgi:DNA-directed RNA polymerase subunit RPC12/RpoP
MITHCPICGKPLSELELVVSEHDMSYQCHHCWNRIRVAEADSSSGELVETASGGAGSRSHGTARPGRDQRRKR